MQNAKCKMEHQDRASPERPLRVAHVPHPDFAFRAQHSRVDGKPGRILHFSF
jgi:hypothetical protein